MKKKLHANGIQRAAAVRFHYQQYLHQLRNQNENNALNRRLGCRLKQISAIEVSNPSTTDKKFACQDLFLSMSESVPTCHGRFLSLS